MSSFYFIVCSILFRLLGPLKRCVDLSPATILYFVFPQTFEIPQLQCVKTFQHDKHDENDLFLLFVDGFWNVLRLFLAGLSSEALTIVKWVPRESHFVRIVLLLFVVHFSALMLNTSANYLEAQKLTRLEHANKFSMRYQFRSDFNSSFQNFVCTLYLFCSWTWNPLISA